MSKKSKPGIVYKITNNETGESYIGSSKNNLSTVKSRYRHHSKNKKGRPILDAIRIFSISAFQFETLERSKSKEYRKQREAYWISFYDTFNSGYNATPDGQKLRRSKCQIV